MGRFDVRQILLLTVLVCLTATARGESFVLPPEGNDLVGYLREVQVHPDETLIDIGRRHSIGYEEMVRANPGVDPWIPGGGTVVRLPTRFILPPGPREGLVINLPEYRLYYYPKVGKGEAPRVETYPISIGRMDWATPLGRHKVVTKVKDPAWYPPKSVKEEALAQGKELPNVVPPGPDNPLGAYAIRLDIPGYLIHSTNKPAGVGMRVTHGCIRMFPEDIEGLFPNVSVGTPVHVLNEPVKVGWASGELYVEVHPPLEEDRAGRVRLELTRLIEDATAGGASPVDWRRAGDAWSEARGYPEPIGADSAAQVANLGEVARNP